jgi:hypothetical protein
VSAPQARRRLSRLRRAGQASARPLNSIVRLLMSFRSKVIVAVGLLVFFAGGLLLGGRVGWAKMDDFCGRVMQSSGAAVSADLLARHLTVVDALRSGDVQGAQKRLLFLVGSEAAQVSECRARPECAKLFPTQLSSPEILERAKSLSNLTTGSTARAAR